MTSVSYFECDIKPNNRFTFDSISPTPFLPEWFFPISMVTWLELYKQEERDSFSRNSLQLLKVLCPPNADQSALTFYTQKFYCEATWCRYTHTYARTQQIHSTLTKAWEHKHTRSSTAMLLKVMPKFLGIYAVPNKPPATQTDFLETGHKIVFSVQMIFWILFIFSLTGTKWEKLAITVSDQELQTRLAG